MPSLLPVVLVFCQFFSSYHEFMNTRAIAAKILAGVLSEGQSLTELLQKNIPKNLPGRDQALVKEICFGVCRWYYRLELIANQLVYKPIKAKEAEIRSLLLIGLYQLIYLETPSYAALAETVGAAEVLKKFWAKGLINQALRRFLENSSSFSQEADANLTGRFAHPAWMIEELQKAWPLLWQQILMANNEHAPLFLRVNPQKCSREEYLLLLKNAGIEALALEELSQAVRLVTPVKVENLPEFANGYCTVQDLASQYVFQLLDLGEGHRVLDAAAAPGGKTTHILESAPFISELIAIDRDPIRLKKVEENRQRLQLPKNLLRYFAGDAADTASWWDGGFFDRILLDAPCSGTGVIRRHPDIKILRKYHDVEQYVKQQTLLLEALWPLLKPGGRLLYTTCSVFPLENEKNIEKFCFTHPDATPWAVKLNTGFELKYGRQLFPESQSHDGFFFSLLSKINP